VIITQVAQVEMEEEVSYCKRPNSTRCNDGEVIQAIAKARGQFICCCRAVELDGVLTIGGQ
jgi:hypothetical protein